MLPVTKMNMIYVSANSHLPRELQQIPGVKWYVATNMEEVKGLLGRLQGEVEVLVQAQNLGLRTLEAFLSWMHLRDRLNFIFIAETVEKTVYPRALKDSSVLILRGSEKYKVKELITHRILGGEIKSRRQERLHVQTPVMLKKSVLSDNSPAGSRVQVLREGEMSDFSQGGALIMVQESTVKPKDFISLMYRDHKGIWISVESQVRWLKPGPPGHQIMGLQFLAVSA